MESKAIDPAGFREAQHKNWDSAATGWNEWREFNDRADRHISERLVELAGVRPGSRVLDVAAGYGEPALTAARKAGPEGSVVATDISAEMLAFGRERAAVAGLGNVEFMESDASGLYSDEDDDGAAGCAPAPGRNAGASLPAHPRRHRRAARRRWVLGGRRREDEVTFEFDSPEHFTAYVRAIAAPIRAMIAQYAGDAQGEAWDAITQAAAEVGGGSKPLSLSNVVRSPRQRRSAAALAGCPRADPTSHWVAENPELDALQ